MVSNFQTRLHEHARRIVDYNVQTAHCDATQYHRDRAAKLNSCLAVRVLHVKPPWPVRLRLNKLQLDHPLLQNVPADPVGENAALVDVSATGACMRVHPHCQFKTTTDTNRKYILEEKYITCCCRNSILPRVGDKVEMPICIRQVSHVGGWRDVEEMQGFMLENTDLTCSSTSSLTALKGCKARLTWEMEAGQANRAVTGWCRKDLFTASHREKQALHPGTANSARAHGNCRSAPQAAAKSRICRVG
eukprot:2931554-Rhodomonas_salina.1